MIDPRRSLVALVTLAAVVAAAGSEATATRSAAEGTHTIGHVASEHGPAEHNPAGTTTYRPITPCRLHDSRAGGTPVTAGSTTEVRITSRCGTPSTVRAAAVTITVVEPQAPGFVSAWGDGQRPSSSNVNHWTGQTTANSTVVPVGVDGNIRLHTHAETHLLVDVTGVFVDAPSARSGRFVAMTAERVLDTRHGDTAPLATTTTRVPLPVGVDPDATGLAVTVTVVGARRDGFLTAYPRGSTRPEASMLNVVAGETRAASAIVPVSPDGLTIYHGAGGHLIVDVTGWFTGSSAEDDVDGLFVPVTPVRLHDSRSPRRTLDAGATREVTVPTEASAWALNIAAADPRAAGYTTVHPARTPRPDTSTLNHDGGGAASNSVLTPVSTHGFAVYASAPVDIVVDGFGWFTGTPVASTASAAPDRVAPERVLVVGDSAAAGIRWTAGARDALRGAHYTIDLESCRRLVRPSCRGREGYHPSTALQAVERQPGGAFDTLVMATGYNDVHEDLPPAIDAITSAAHTRGIRNVVWLTYREQVGYQIPSGASTSYALMNATLHDRAATGPLRVLDWWEYTRGAGHWFSSDGVHLSTLGAYGMADAISRSLAAGERRTCPVPWSAGEPRESPCPHPDPLPAERGGVPDVETLYDL